MEWKGQGIMMRKGSKEWSEWTRERRRKEKRGNMRGEIGEKKGRKKEVVPLIFQNVIAPWIKHFKPETVINIKR